MHFNVYDEFYSLYAHQHVSDTVAETFKVMLLLQEHKGTYLVSCVT
jgi:hypothetical protein